MAAPRLSLDQLSPHIRAALASQDPAPAEAARSPRKVARGPSPLEESFANQSRLAGLPTPQREYRFHHARAWRFDFAWPDLRLAVEVEGGVWTGGRHTRGSGFIADCDKYNAAALLGWRVLRFAESHVRDGTAVQILREALAFRPTQSVP